MSYDQSVRYAQRGGYTPAEQQRRERLRLEAAGRFARGDSTGEIAAQLRVTDRTVRRWRQAWRDGGAAALRSRGPVSRERLSPQQWARLEGIWSLLKRAMVNCAAADLDGLVRIVKRKLKNIQYRPHMIDGCLAASGLWLGGQSPPGQRAQRRAVRPTNRRRTLREQPQQARVPPRMAMAETLVLEAAPFWRSRPWWTILADGRCPLQEGSCRRTMASLHYGCPGHLAVAEGRLSAGLPPLAGT